MSKMRKFKYLWLILLVLILSACGVFGSKTFNEDGFEASPFSFEHPLGWEVLYTEQETWAFQDASEIKIGDDGNLTGFFAGTVGVGFHVLMPEFINEQFGTTEIAPIEMLQQYEQRVTEFRQTHESRNDEESSESTGLKSFLQEPIYILNNVTESPTSYQICDKNVVGMKAQEYTTMSFSETPIRETWRFLTVMDDQVIEIVGLHDMNDAERFEEIFESIICSLEVHESE